MKEMKEGLLRTLPTIFLAWKTVKKTGRQGMVSGSVSR
jgi:hypothetical protein